MIRVRTIGVGPGTSADITDAVSGLSWSSINPGGDERATFRVKRPWFSDSADLRQGNVLAIEDNMERLWTGRIEELTRATDGSESIQVTAYGLGIRLRDDASYMRLFVDRDPAKWGDAPFNRKVGMAGGAIAFGDFSWSQEAGGLICALPNQALGSSTIGEAWYTAPNGETIAKFMYIGSDSSLPASWEAAKLFILADDAAATAETYALSLDGTLRTPAITPARRYAMLRQYSNGTASTPAAGANRRYSKIAVYGNHGLTTRSIDASTPDGLYGGDIVGSLISGVTGISTLRIDAPTTVVPHFVLDSPGTREDGIRALNQFFGYDWGTFGPATVIDTAATSTTGYFYWQAPDTSTAHWSLRRADCDDINLNVELATLYNQVIVTYTDPTTTGTQTVTRTATVQALSDVSITRTARLDGGVLTLAGAQTLGDAFLNLSGQVPPARGSVTLSGNVPHYRRGSLPCHYMRADGSNLKVDDILPGSRAVSLIGLTDDRQTLFPVQRVEVDCSGDAPRATVEVDQARDTLSVLQARLSLAASFPNGIPG